MARERPRAALGYTRGKSLVGAAMVLCIVVLFSVNSQVMAGLSAHARGGRPAAEPSVSAFLIIWLCHACLARVPLHWVRRGGFWPPASSFPGLIALFGICRPHRGRR